jgi:hypothetical protein
MGYMGRFYDCFPRRVVCKKAAYLVGVDDVLYALLMPPDDVVLLHNLPPTHITSSASTRLYSK